MPLMMPSSFHPMENGDYLLLGEDHGAEHPGDHAGTRRTTPTPTTATTTTSTGSCQAIKPLFDNAAAEHLRQATPRTQADVAWLLDAPRRRRAEGACTTSSGCSPAAPPDLLDDYFENDIVKGYHRLVERSSAPRSARCRRAPGWCCCSTRWASTTAHLGAWAFHKGGNGGFTQVLARAAEAFGAEIRLESPVDDGDHARTAAPSASRSRTAPSSTRRSSCRRSTRGARSSSSSTRASCPTDLVDEHRADAVPGHSAKVNFALDGLPVYPALPDTRRPVRRLHQHRADDRVPRAGLRRRRSTAGTASGPYIDARSSPSSTPTWRRPAST